MELRERHREPYSRYVQLGAGADVYHLHSCGLRQDNERIQDGCAVEVPQSHFPPFQRHEDEHEPLFPWSGTHCLYRGSAFCHRFHHHGSAYGHIAWAVYRIAQYGSLFAARVDTHCHASVPGKLGIDRWQLLGDGRVDVTGVYCGASHARPLPHAQDNG